MRTTTAVTGAIVMLLLGALALSQAADSSRQTAMNSSNASANAWNLTTDTVGGVLQSAGPAVVWGGIGAIVLVATGFLAYSIGGGR